MNSVEARFRRLPVLQELFDQWLRARGAASPGEYQKSFSRNWETLLGDAGLTSAESRREAERDALSLETAGLARLTTAKYRAYQIERITLPLEAEPRLRELFADQLPPPPDPRFDPTTIRWAPEMRFVPQTKTFVAPEDLLRLNDFFLNGGATRTAIPVKERSLQIFGDEKRLDALRGTSLFKGHLTLDALRCFTAAEPLGWQRGAHSEPPIIVIENAATWDSYCRWNREQKHFSAVVYGCGNRFADSVVRLGDIFAELGGPRAVYYFGDLDPPGLRIPQLASAYAMAYSLSVKIEPHIWSYRQLLVLGAGHETSWDGDPSTRAECDWLGELADDAWAILAAGKRLAQEYVGWEFLSQAGGQ